MQETALDSSKGHAQIQMDLLKGAPGEANCLFEGEHSLFISLSARPVPYLHAQDGKTFTGLYQRGEMLVTPANMPLFARWEGEEDTLHIRLTDEFVRNVARETVVGDCDRITLKPEFHARNPQIESISTMLLNELQQGSLSNRLYIDSLSNILAVNLLRQHATTRPYLPTYEGGLPSRQLSQLLDYIDAHIDQEIKLADLAQLLDMSQFHFSRLFKQSLGVSPYQYLLQQRVERAKQLLKNTDRLITDIALICGFNSHSHLSKQFKQLTGMTPKAYRAS
ncbi:MAG: AraC family transcriptional regulator [Cyanobacteria bacterium J06649_4]